MAASDRKEHFKPNANPAKKIQTQIVTTKDWLLHPRIVERLLRGKDAWSGLDFNHPESFALAMGMLTHYRSFPDILSEAFFEKLLAFKPNINCDNPFFRANPALAIILLQWLNQYHPKLVLKDFFNRDVFDGKVGFVPQWESMVRSIQSYPVDGQLLKKVFQRILDFIRNERNKPGKRLFPILVELFDKFENYIRDPRISKPNEQDLNDFIQRFKDSALEFQVALFNDLIEAGKNVRPAPLEPPKVSNPNNMLPDIQRQIVSRYFSNHEFAILLRVSKHFLFADEYAEKERKKFRAYVDVAQDERLDSVKSFWSKLIELARAKRLDAEVVFYDEALFSDAYCIMECFPFFMHAMTVMCQNDQFNSLDRMLRIFQQARAQRRMSDEQDGRLLNQSSYEEMLRFGHRINNAVKRYKYLFCLLKNYRIFCKITSTPANEAKQHGVPCVSLPYSSFYSIVGLLNGLKSITLFLPDKALPMLGLIREIELMVSSAEWNQGEKFHMAVLASFSELFGNQRARLSSLPSIIFDQDHLNLDWTCESRLAVISTGRVAGAAGAGAGANPAAAAAGAGVDANPVAVAARRTMNLFAAQAVPGLDDKPVPPPGMAARVNDGP